jgi:hypothetical protein
LGGIAGDVSQQNRGIRKKFSELAVGDEKRAKSAESVKRLVAVLLGGVLVDGRTGQACAGTGDLLCLPNEVLEQVAVVLGEEQTLACSMTVLRSPTSFWPSLDSFLDGEPSAFDASAELSAMSICLLDGTFPLENAEVTGLAHVPCVECGARQ